MKFSIVTVAYNAANTIGDALASIVGQKNAEIESIVIDGGSRDKTMEIVSSFGARIARVVSEPDRGIYDAMNKGLALATGDVVAFLNADDYYADDTTLAFVAQTLASTGATLAAGAVEQVNPAGRVVRTIRATAYRPGKYRWGYFPPHPGLFVTTAIARGTGGFDPGFRIGGDFEFFIRMSRRADFRLTTVDRTLVKMRTGGVSTSGMGVYLDISRDMKRALVKNGFKTGHWRIDLRGLRKFPELFSWPRRPPCA